MGIEYAKVLRAHGRTFLIIGRGDSSARRFEDATGLTPIRGGLESFLKGSAARIPQQAIVAVGVDDLARITQTLLQVGVRKILLEKPGGLTHEEIARVAEAANRCSAEVFVAYNRRFYASVRRGREIVSEDGGVVSFFFEFTEWSDQISTSPIPMAVKQNWLLANSSHVLDLAFHFGGKPAQICSFKRGSLPWHTAGSSFAGAGVTVQDALFSYAANWEAPGRWGIEVLTKHWRLIYRPLEELKIQRLKSVE